MSNSQSDGRKRPLKDITNLSPKERKQLRHNNYKAVNRLKDSLERIRTRNDENSDYDVLIKWQMAITDKKSGKVECYESPGSNSDIKERFYFLGYQKLSP